MSKSRRIRFDETPEAIKHSAPLKPRDTEVHSKTRMRGERRSVHETTVWKFRDPRGAKVRIYKSVEGLPWALTDLVKKTNVAIEGGQVPGKALGPGDVIQAAVVSYFVNGEVHKPQTTDDSPGYATLPYKLVITEGGYWTAEPALPAEALIHFKVPDTVGGLIPNLPEAAGGEILVSMQLKEATYASQDDLARGEQYASPPVLEYEDVDTKGNDLFGFQRFLEHNREEQESGEWRYLVSDLGEESGGGDQDSGGELFNFGRAQ